MVGVGARVVAGCRPWCACRTYHACCGVVGLVTGEDEPVDGMVDGGTTGYLVVSVVGKDGVQAVDGGTAMVWLWTVRRRV